MSSLGVWIDQDCSLKWWASSLAAAIEFFKSLYSSSLVMVLTAAL